MTQYHDIKYLNLLEDILQNGTNKTDRTGTGTRSVFARQMRFDLSDGTIPLLTTKKIHLKSIIHEILWYLQGTGNIKYLQDNGIRIWNEWADSNGDLGNIYGVQWRKWKQYVNIPDSPEHYQIKEIDQIANVIHTLRTNPDDRRMIVNSWNVGELTDMKLPPCHYVFQFYVNDEKLSCILNQRSADGFLGVPFNIVQYSILTRMVAQVTNLQPGEFIWNGGDVHIYNNHFEQVKEQLIRVPYPSPTLRLNKSIKEIDDFGFDDFIIENYNSYPTIKAQVAV